jgi:hypothetical protein
VAHEDGWLLQLSYDSFVVFDNPKDSPSLNRGGVFVERLDLYLEARVCGGERTVALALVVLDPVLPASGGHPEAVDQNYGVGGSRIGAVVGGDESVQKEDDSSGGALHQRAAIVSRQAAEIDADISKDARLQTARQ